MKLTTLLAQYLYTNHRLDLPGIGNFLLDASTLDPVENTKQKTLLLSGVSFENNPAATAPPELIAFISANTGKMKALAAADLESFIELAQQFLNIGKPFTFEGIGTLIKTKPGLYDFVPDTVPADKIKGQLAKEAKPVEEAGSAAAEKYESFLSAPRQRAGMRKPVLILLGIIGLGLAVWGGYTISKKKNKTETAGTQPVSPKEETTTDAQPADSIKPAAPATTAPTASTSSSAYKYILEVADSKRAFKRYNQLRTNLWDVHLETKDSVTYKLFMTLPVSYGDTTHILDSLKIWTGRSVYIEHAQTE
ncbi:MAG TPA: hypothetical protein PKC69_15625 [Chitinophagaceae bacterium]|nr:hypothetical protein [Chitinophagaceae bacterium]